MIIEHSRGRTKVTLWPSVMGLRQLTEYIDRVFSNPNNPEAYALRGMEVISMNVTRGHPHGDYGQVVEITFKDNTELEIPVEFTTLRLGA